MLREMLRGELQLGDKIQASETECRQLPPSVFLHCNSSTRRRPRKPLFPWGELAERPHGICTIHANSLRWTVEKVYICLVLVLASMSISPFSHRLPLL